jgi:hypothetical protein
MERERERDRTLKIIADLGKIERIRPVSDT